MPLPGHTQGEGEAPESQPETAFTQEQVEQMLAERDRQWQGRMTPLHQERAELRRSLGQLEGRFNAWVEQQERRSEQPAGPAQSRPDLDAIRTGEDLERAMEWKFRELVERDGRSERSRPERTDPSPTEARMEDFLLQQEEAKVRQAYPGVSDEEVRQIFDLGIRTENGDLNWLAYKVLGAPDHWKRGRSRQDADEEQPRSQSQTVLAGRARATTARTQQAPKEVVLKKGMAGYRQADSIGEEFLRGRGHS